MPFYFFQWDDENEAHLAEHGVSIDEFAKSSVIPTASTPAALPGVPSHLGTRPQGSTWRACTSCWMSRRSTPSRLLNRRIERCHDARRNTFDAS
jgi:hypothetical protein